MVATIQLAGSIMGAVESMAMARIAGFDESQAVSVLASTSGGSRALVDYVPRIVKNDYSGNIKVSEFLDMLDVALDAAESLDITLPGVETAYQLCDLLSVVGGDDMNIQALALLYEDEETCAKYGLDWALADEVSRGGYDGMNGYDDGGSDNRRRGFGGLGQGPSGMGGGRDAGDNGSGGESGGWYPPIDGFFSKN